MKRMLILALAVVLCLPLFACKSDEVRTVQRMINRIGTVTVGSEVRIEKAEDAYDDLSEYEKRCVSNYGVLLEARRTYDSLFETVELTRENWDDYFEIDEVVWWAEGGFVYDIRFKLRDEYAGSYRRGKSIFIAELRLDSGVKYCNYDHQTKKASLEAVAPENLPQIIDIEVEPAQSVTARSRDADPYSSETPVFRRIEGEAHLEKSAVICRDGTIAFLVDTMELVSIRGTLVLLK